MMAGASVGAAQFRRGSYGEPIRQPSRAAFDGSFNF